MRSLVYYLDTDNGFLFAYEKESEFFVRYLPKTNEWEDSPISFSNFRHDYYFKEITKEEALFKTNGNLPEKLLGRYLELLDKNRGL